MSPIGVKSTSMLPTKRWGDMSIPPDQRSTPWNAKDIQPCVAFQSITGEKITQARAKATYGSGRFSQCRDSLSMIKKRSEAGANKMIRILRQHPQTKANACPHPSPSASCQEGTLKKIETSCPCCVEWRIRGHEKTVEKIDGENGKKHKGYECCCFSKEVLGQSVHEESSNKP